KRIIDYDLKEIEAKLTKQLSDVEKQQRNIETSLKKVREEKAGPPGEGSGQTEARHQFVFDLEKDLQQQEGENALLKARLCDTFEQVPVWTEVAKRMQGDLA